VKKVWTDRSRILSFQRCPRSRWYEYHQDSLGIRSARLPLPLAVGLSVHVGLAELLQCYLSVAPNYKSIDELLASGVLRAFENDAVRAALADFATHSPALSLDTTELAAQTAGVDLVALGDPAAMDAQSKAILDEVGRAQREYDRYLAAEQTALVEGMVRAYARRRLRVLLEQFEVLEVEREGEWLLAGGVVCSDCGTRQSEHQREYDLDCQCGGSFKTAPELWFMSRPDALLRERDSNELYLLSYKTAASWDVRKARDAEHDMQGLSEGVEVERRLAAAWDEIHKEANANVFDESGRVAMKEKYGESTWSFLWRLPAPPRILAVRYEYLLKGDRWIDKPLTSRLGIEVRSQRSPLVRGYLNSGMTAGDEQWNVSWDYHKEDGTTSKLYWKSWQSAPVWESMPVAKWIDMLDQTAMATVADADASGQDVRELGWKSDAQTTGFLSTHPLDDVFVPPVTVFRNDDDLRDMVEQIEAQEVGVARAVAVVDAATDEGERRHLMNVYFPMHRQKCEYPSTCAFVKLCYGGADIRKDPLGSEQYVVREPNHVFEKEAANGPATR
jgi:hypothetical protein